MLSLLTLATGALSLGINCRGSSECAANQFNGLQTMRDYICDGSHGLLDQHFNDGEHIAYATKTVSGSASIAGPSGIGAGGSGSGEYDYALFFQHTGKSHTGQEACNLLETLMKHGCTGCGSVPTSMENGGPNSNVKNGQLTLNYIR